VVETLRGRIAAMQVARSPVTICEDMAYVSEVNSSITTIVEDKNRTVGSAGCLAGFSNNSIQQSSCCPNQMGAEM
jgi:hypothetical protein